MSFLSEIFANSHELDFECDYEYLQNTDFDLDSLFSNQESTYLTEPISTDIFDDDKTLYRKTEFAHHTWEGMFSNGYEFLNSRNIVIHRNDVIPSVNPKCYSYGSTVNVNATRAFDSNKIYSCNYPILERRLTLCNGQKMAPDPSEDNTMNPSTSYDGLVSERHRIKSTGASLGTKIPYNGVFVQKMIPEEFVKKADVLFGRGKKSNNHDGNKSFRGIVMRMATQYKDCNRTQKTALSNSIVNEILNRGGRFLTPVSRESNLWVEMRGVALRKKTSQALRDCTIYQK